MKVAVEAMEGCKRRLAVEAPVDVVQKEWERAYGRVQKQARLPGFRRGHVPRSLVKLHFAADVRREVAEHLIGDVYRRALAEARLDPVNDPDLRDVRLEEDAPLSFVAIVEVKPAITLGEYRGVAVRHAPVAVTDDDVNAALEGMRETQAQFRSVERPAAEGDLVVVDYTLRPDGHPPTIETGRPFLVGAGTAMPEVGAAVAGLRPGDEREVVVQFPADHRVETVRGREGTLAVKVIEVKEKTLPPLDDELAKSLGPWETLDGLRAELRQRLEAQRAHDEHRALEEKVVDAVLARREFAVPETLVLRQIAYQVERARDRMRRQGVDPDRLSWDLEKLATELRPGAARAVRRALLLEAIAEKEGLAPSEADVDAQVDRLARASRRPTPAVRRMMEKEGELEGLRLGLRERLTLDLLVRHAVVRA